jgi:hypothetical protein
MKHITKIIVGLALGAALALAISAHGQTSTYICDSIGAAVNYGVHLSRWNVAGIDNRQYEVLGNGISFAQLVELPYSHRRIASGGDESQPRPPGKPNLLAMGLIAMGVVISAFLCWYTQFREVSYGTFPCLVGCLGCIAYGTYMLLQ